MSLPYNKKNITLTKNLRNHSTRHEKRLWYDFLSKYPVRFQRQKAIDDYIADFYCHKAKLVIELDGIQHGLEDAIKKDEHRTEVLSKYGLTVIRITNKQIDCNFAGICDHIDHIVRERTES